MSTSVHQSFQPARSLKAFFEGERWRGHRLLELALFLLCYTPRSFLRRELEWEKQPGVLAISVWQCGQKEFYHYIYKLLHSLRTVEEAHLCALLFTHLWSVRVQTWALPVVSPILWNTLPKEISPLHSLITFCRQVKSWLFAKEFFSWLIAVYFHYLYNYATSPFLLQITTEDHRVNCMFRDGQGLNPSVNAWASLLTHW